MAAPLAGAASRSRDAGAIPSVGPAFLRRTVWASVLTGGVGALVVAARWGAEAGLGFLTGLAWGLANFWALGEILRSVATIHGKNVGRAILFGLFKIVLYAAGIALLFKAWLPLPALVAGFSWLFLVVVLRAAGALMSGKGAAPAGERN